MEPYYLRTGQFESDQVVYNKLLPCFELERLSSHRSTVYRFALLMAQCLLDDVDTEVRRDMIHHVVRVIKVGEKPIYGLL